jgi:hypothetical protein
MSALAMGFCESDFREERRRIKVKYKKERSDLAWVTMLVGFLGQFHIRDGTIVHWASG